MNSSVTTNSSNNFKDDYLYATKKYYKVMEKYRGFFSKIFRLPVLTFGYIRCLDNGDTVCFDSSPKLIELFCDTKGLEDDSAQPGFNKVKSGNVFLYTNYDINNIKHNNFRSEAEKRLDIKQSFLVVEKFTNYYHIIPFSFGHVPSRSSSLLEDQNIILMDCVNNNQAIKACFEQFKKEMFHIIEDKDLYKTNLKNIKKDNYETQEFVQDKSNNDIRGALLGAGIIEEKDLMLQHIRFTPQEKRVLSYYLQGMSAKEIAKEIQRSNKTIEEHINTVKAKLNVKKK